MANVSPAEVGLVEAHGTGTVVGDKTELATLTEVYRRAGAAAGSCVLGSVKSQIGHTKCAAGMAGLIKVALAIHHGVLPPTLNLKKPNAAWDAGDSPFLFLDQALFDHPTGDLADSTGGSETRYRAGYGFGAWLPTSVGRAGLSLGWGRGDGPLDAKLHLTLKSQF